MFYPKAKIMVSGADKITAQAREASAAAAGRAREATSAAAQTAAQTVAQAATAAAQTAAEAASESVRKSIFSARGWVAPRLENAADYTTDTVAPKVSSMLRDTARQISPPDRRHKGFRPALRWSLLATAAFTAAGAALMVWQRYRAAMAARTGDAEAPVQPATGTEPVPPTGSAPTDGSADTGANGKVSAPG